MRSEVAMSGYIRIRVFQDEKQTLKEVARKKGTSLSELIRDAVITPSKNDGGKRCL